MTIFGADISNWQAGLDLHQVAAEGFEFVICKVSEGAGYRDPTWPGFRDQARDAGLRLAGYHYVRADSDPYAQARTFVDHLGDTTIPVMLDHEMNSGGIGVYWNVVNAINDLGVEVSLSYIPRWYWSGHMGSPDLSQVPGLVSSSYVLGSGFASALYPGDHWNGWAAYGGCEPVFCQFTDRAQVAGQRIDAMAFKGSTVELDMLFGNVTTAVGSEDGMTPDQDRMLREVHEALYAPRQSLVDGSTAEFSMIDFVRLIDAATWHINNKEAGRE